MTEAPSPRSPGCTGGGLVVGEETLARRPLPAATHRSLFSSWLVHESTVS